MKRLYLLLVLLLLAACVAPAAPTEESSPTAPLVAATLPVTVVEVETASTPVPTAVPVPTETPVPTPEPTPEPTPTEAPTPTPFVITAERLTSGEFDSWFDNTAFVGDSITRSFGNYVRDKRAKQPSFLGTAQFLGAVSMSASLASRNKTTDDINFYYRGRAVTVTEAISAMGAKRAFLMLGVNDIGGRNWESVQNSFDRLIGNIRSECPDTELYVQGILPVTKKYCKAHDLDIQKWNSFNDILAEICERNGVLYISFADRVMNDEGYLDPALSSDEYFHLNEAGDEIWITFLREYAARQMYPDAAIETP